MEMISWPLSSKEQTVKEIKNAVNSFHSDLLKFPHLVKMSIAEYYNFVKNIPYVQDVKDTEIVSRPLYLLTVFKALDCKKKSILFASYMLLKFGRGSYRFVLSSNRPDGSIGHIFTQIKNGDKWTNADATYSRNRIGQKKRVTNFEIVKG